MSNIDISRQALLERRQKRMDLIAAQDPEISAIDKVLGMFSSRTTTNRGSQLNIPLTPTISGTPTKSISDAFRMCLEEMSGEFTASQLHDALNTKMGVEVNKNTLHGQVSRAKEDKKIEVVQDRIGRNPAIYKISIQ